MVYHNFRTRLMGSADFELCSPCFNFLSPGVTCHFGNAFFVHQASGAQIKFNNINDFYWLNMRYQHWEIEILLEIIN